MTIIFNNIAANAATAFTYPATGCEAKILFRADNWGTTQIEIASYSLNDPFMKMWIDPPSPISGNIDMFFSGSGAETAYMFTVLNPDTLTTQLFVEVQLKGCCCTTTGTTCFELPIKLVSC